MMPDTSVTDTLEVSANGHSVEIRRVESPNGERLDISSQAATVRLDAVALESLTWQDSEFFARIADGSNAARNSVEESTEIEDGPPEVQVGNEYTFVELRIVETNTGDRLAIHSPKLGYTCHCTPAELEAISRKDDEFFSELLETPLGPESDHHGAH